MCGIAGIVRWNGQTVLKDELILMNEYLKERGPDHQGYWLKKNVGFAHSRLSIIDLSKQGNQPMSDTDKLVWITYNGEVYNFLEIRKELEQKGTKFRSNSDTEILIYGYLQWGIDNLLKKLNGMFAFSIWDSRSKEVILARDRFGQKPLYYYQNENELLFSSDIRSIWSLKKNYLKIDYNSLNYFLTELSTPQPNTIWSEIKQVPPSSFITISKTASDIKKYWTLNYGNKQKMSFGDACEETKRLLDQSVKARMVSDVPIGSFLSGGVDSGLVSSILAQHSDKPINTYTVSFNDTDLDESKEALIVANKFNTNHHELLAETDISKELDKLINYFGEPFADDSQIPTYMVSKKVKKHCTVIMSGDGGDELFGGYHEYLSAFNTDQYLKITPKIYRNFITLISKAKSRINDSCSNLGHLKAFSQLDPYKYLIRGIGLSIEDIRNLQVKNHFTKTYLKNIWDNAEGDFLASKIMSGSINTRLLNAYLVKVDRSSMINSLEVRSPFLDYKLAEFAASIPNEHIFKGSRPKAILKHLAKHIFDSNIDKRPKKGFGLPLDHWLKTSLKEELAFHLIDSCSLDKVSIDIIEVKKMCFNFLEKNNVSPYKIWTLFCLDKWCKTYL